MFNIFGGNYLGDYSIRYAKEIVKDKVAFKINLSQLTGADFRADDYRNVGSGPIYEQEHNRYTQGVNGINTYGDERAAYLSLPTISRLGILTDSVFAVTRTGYKEGLLVNYDANNTKINGALHFKLSPKTQLILASFYGNASTMITGDDRIALRDFEMAQHKIELKNEDFFVRGYTTTQNAGNSFNVGSLAESLVQAAKLDSD